ncbi:hypothetical protein Hanom_Chr04g00334161 [Helianthus anomalus]
MKLNSKIKSSECYSHRYHGSPTDFPSDVILQCWKHLAPTHPVFSHCSTQSLLNQKFQVKETLVL